MFNFELVIFSSIDYCATIEIKFDFSDLHQILSLHHFEEIEARRE